VVNGKNLRTGVPRSLVADWTPSPDRPDPIAVLRAQEHERVAELLPIRHERMRASPFGFFRGAAAVMAADLARIAVTGLFVQLCGDAHLANFGGFATPERRLIFDVNDFDETLPGPWEWDVLRLAASVEVAAADRGFRRRDRARAVYAAVCSYRLRMRAFAAMTPLEIWYSYTNVRRVAEIQRSSKMGAGEHLPPKLVEDERGALRFRPDPPLVEPLDSSDERAIGVQHLLRAYGESLPAHVRVLIDRYRLADLARKVVGVGSVGTRCFVALLLTDRNEPLLLQLKEAVASVHEAYLPHSAFSNHAERVVFGQRLMQAASDVFLGWTSGKDGHDYYIRQLRDMKVVVDLALLDANALADYASHCGEVLARAHARSGNPQAIAAYLGKSDAFERSCVSFATAYAEQNRRDYESFCSAATA
jgi:uncharacterized protein (DUF2252 family)